MTKKILSPSFSSEKLPHPKPSNNRSILGLIKKSQSLNALQQPKSQKKKLSSFKDDSSKKGLVKEAPKSKQHDTIPACFQDLRMVCQNDSQSKAEHLFE